MKPARPRMLGGLKECDVQLAREGDMGAKSRVKTQKKRIARRLRDIEEWDRLYGAKESDAEECGAKEGGAEESGDSGGGGAEIDFGDDSLTFDSVSTQLPVPSARSSSPHPRRYV